MYLSLYYCYCFYVVLLFITVWFRGAKIRLFFDMEVFFDLG